MKRNINLVTCSLLFWVTLITINIYAQNIDSSITLKIKTIPHALKIYNDPLKFETKGDSIITITANANTNLFNSPQGNWNRQNAPMILFHPDSNFILSAKVKANLKEVYDVAALVVYHDNDFWAKLCFENSADKEAMIVSVVTKKYSDDCNSAKLANNYVYLAIAKKGKEYSFHYSKDNLKWKLIRHFRIELSDNNTLIGFAVHCYAGKMFSADFSDIYYSNNTLGNMRKYK